MKTQLDRYIPQDASAKYFNDVEAVVYRYQDKKPCAIAYSGKRHRSDFHSLYLSEEAREQAIAGWVESLRRMKQLKEERAAARKAFKPTLQVGDILVSSWGYDQTNVDYYEVTMLKGVKSVWVRKIACSLEGTGHMCGRAMPVKGHYLSDPALKRVGQGNRVRIDDVRKAYPWDGKANYCSWYA